MEKLRPYANAILGMLLGVFVLLKLIGFIETVPFLIGLGLVVLLTIGNAAVGVRSQRSLRYGGNMVIVVLLFVTVVVVVQMISTTRNWAWDVTENRRFSLADQTVKVLRNLAQPVEVIAFFPDGQSEPVEDLLQRYRDFSGEFQYRIVDADKKPAEAKPYNARNGQIVFVTGDKKETIAAVDEEPITNALIRVTREGRKKLYFTTGHGELNPEDSAGETGLSLAKKALEDKNYAIETLNLVDHETVPEDCSLLVIAGPKFDFLGGEVERLRSYVERAGAQMIVMLDPFEPKPGSVSEPMKELPAFLAEYNLIADNSIIIDQDIRNQLFGGDLTVTLVTKYEAHPITDPLKGTMSIFPLARSVSTGESGRGTAKILARAGDQAWGETDLDLIFRERRAAPDANVDVIGSPGVMALSEIPAVTIPGLPESESEGGSESEGSRIILFGDSDFAANGRVAQAGNWALMLNTVNWLAGESDLVAIPPKTGTGSPVFLSRKQASLVSWLPVIVLPLLVMVVGSVVIISRRQLKSMPVES